MVLMKTQTKRTTRRPKLEDFEDVIRERAKDEQLKKGLQDAAAEKVSALALATEKPLSVEDRARRLIAGEDLKSDGVDLQAELRKATEKQAVYERAVQEQSKTVRSIEMGRSREICSSVEDQYRSLVQVVVDKIKLAIAAEQEARNFVAVLDKEGVLSAYNFLPTEPLAIENLDAWLGRARAQNYDA